MAQAHEALSKIEETLQGVFNYYAQVCTGRSKDGRKPMRMMTSAKFQRMAFDANMVDDSLTHAQLDLLFRQASGKKGRLEFSNFMDAVVLLALAKFPDLGPELREFTALTKLYEEYLSSFNGDVNDPLEAIVQDLDEEWYHLMVVKGVAPVLHDLYMRYFPIEVNPHFAQASTTAEAQAAKGFMAVMDDFAVVRQVQDLRAAMYAAVRDAERTAVPPELLERIRVSPAGKYFTFHHFLMALQKLADMQHREGSPAQKLAQLLHVMEQARSPYGKVRFLPAGLVTDASEVIEPQKPQISAEVKSLIQNVYNWYVTLGEPLKRELSTRKFNRFLRDCGLLSPEMVSGSTMQSTMSGAPNLGRSQMSNRSGMPGTKGYKYAFSPTKAQQASYAGGAPLAVEDNGLPLRNPDDPDLLLFPEAPLTQVDVDLIFVKARQGKQVFSLMARKGFVYRERGEYGAGYYMVAPGSSAADRTGAAGLDTAARGSGATAMGGQSSHLDPEAFESALEMVAARVYGPAGDVSGHLTTLAEHVLQPLMAVLADQNSLLKVSEVPAYADEVGNETAILFKSVWDGLDKIWKAYKQNCYPGWLLDDFISMVSEFQIIDRIKPVIARRVFYVHAKPLAKNPQLASLTFEAMLDTLVLVAEKIEQANVFQSTTGRVLALLHHMNQVVFRTRLAHLRPLFILPCIPETVVQERQPQGWGNMLATLPGKE